MTDPRTILVTGGAGYVGSVAVPKLLAAGHRVKVLDLYLYGDVLPAHPNLRQIKGDIRDAAVVDDAMDGCDTVIHLACISNDPSFELDPELGKSINLDAFPPLVRVREGARRKSLHLRVHFVGIWGEGRSERDRGPAARAAHGLLTLQGRLRGDPRRGSRARLHRDNPSAGHRLWLRSPPAPRPDGQHPDKPRISPRQDHGVRR